MQLSCATTTLARVANPLSHAERRYPMDAKLLELLVCPVTKGPLDLVRQTAAAAGTAPVAELVSRSARLAYPIRDGIPILLENEARALSPEEIDALPPRVASVS